MWNAYSLPVAPMQIVIDPQPDGLYRVHVFMTEALNGLGKAVIGPLMDGMVCSFSDASCHSSLSHSHSHCWRGVWSLRSLVGACLASWCT